MMKLLPTLLLTLGLLPAMAQMPGAFNQSNYSGLSGIRQNPGRLADNRYQFQVHLFGLNMHVQNNYMNLRTPYNQWHVVNGKLDSFWLDENGVPEFENYMLEERLNGRKKFVNLQTTVSSPSLMLSLPDGSGIAVQTAFRLSVHASGLDEQLLKIFVEDMNNAVPSWNPDANQLRYLGVPAIQESFGFGLHAFNQLGVSYARTLMDEKEHFLKGGLTVNRLTGLAAAYLTMNDLNYELVGLDTLLINSGQLEYAYVNEDFLLDEPNPFARDYAGGDALGKGWGFDLGVVYEFRPNYKEYTYRMDRKRYTDRSSNKYQFKLEASLTDLGRINYNLEKALQRVVYDLPAPIQWNDFTNGGDVSSSGDLDSFVSDLLGTPDTSSTFVMRLPSALHLSADVKLSNHWYAGFQYQQSLRSADVAGTRVQNMLSLNARYEKQRWEAGGNVTFGKFYNPIHIGLYGRIGPLFIGTQMLGGWLGRKSTNGLNVFAGLQFGIPYKRLKDRDNDGISDQEDVCPDEPGSYRAKGCPDADEDGVPDSQDECPDEAGKRSTRGCPDPDLDRLWGANDKCPEEAGPEYAFGCPDADGDSIPDFEDECPTVAGKREWKGCPEPRDSVQTEEKMQVADSVQQNDISEEEKSLAKKEGGFNYPEEIRQLDFDKWDHYAVLGAFKNKSGAEYLSNLLLKETGYPTFLIQNNLNGIYYVTFGKATNRVEAYLHWYRLFKPEVNKIVQGHVWWYQQAKE